MPSMWLSGLEPSTTSLHTPTIDWIVPIMAMAASRQADIRKELSSLGTRIAQLRQEEEELARDIKRGLTKAQRVNIPMTEAADLLGVHRTTLYRAYL
jgi:DNA-binding NtrC family response regulator